MKKHDVSSYAPPEVLLSGRQLERMTEMKKLDASDGTIKTAIIFLMNDYLERTSLKIVGYLDTAEAFEDEPAIASAARAEMGRLRRKVQEAEGLLESLGVPQETD